MFITQNELHKLYRILGGPLISWNCKILMPPLWFKKNFILKRSLNNLASDSFKWSNKHWTIQSWVNWETISCIMINSINQNSTHSEMGYQVANRISLLLELPFWVPYTLPVQLIKKKALGSEFCKTIYINLFTSAICCQLPERVILCPQSWLSLWTKSSPISRATALVCCKLAKLEQQRDWYLTHCR